MPAEHKPCLKCNGIRTLTSPALAPYVYEGQQRPGHPARTYKCPYCDGAGTFPPVDIAAIATAIKGRKGLCSKRPADSRAYYVWRMARFHGGADVTLPMTATFDVAGDPFRTELDIIADAVAKRVFGTDLAGVHRWGRAMGTLDRDMPGLPDSAYSGGRVADCDKPEEEQAELF